MVNYTFISLYRLTWVAHLFLARLVSISYVSSLVIVTIFVVVIPILGMGSPLPPQGLGEYFMRLFVPAQNI